MGNNLFETTYWNKIFLAPTPNIRSLKDKSATKIFMRGFQKVKSNPMQALLKVNFHLHVEYYIT